MSGENITVNTTPTLVTITPTGGTIATVGVQGPAGPQGSPGVGGSPGGSSGQLQYNDSGAFGGASAAYIANGSPQVTSLMFANDPSVGLGGIWQYGSQPTALLAADTADQTLYYQGATGGQDTVGGGIFIKTGDGGFRAGFGRGANSGSITIRFGAGGSGQQQGGEGSLILKDSNGTTWMEMGSSAIITSTTIQSGGFSSVTGGFSVASANIFASADQVLETITAFPGQTANITEWKNSGGTNLAYIGPDGKYHGDGSALTGVGSGTVTSVGASGPSGILTWSSAVTSSGTLTATLATQTANTVFAGPTTGSAAAPTFRSLVAADIPDISGTYAKLAAANTFTVGPQTISINLDANKGLIVKGHSATQSGNLQEWQDNSGTLLSAIQSSGAMRIAGAWANVGDGVAVLGLGVGTITSITGGSAYSALTIRASNYVFGIGATNYVRLNASGTLDLETDGTSTNYMRIAQANNLTTTVTGTNNSGTYAIIFTSNGTTGRASGINCSSTPAFSVSSGGGFVWSSGTVGINGNDTGIGRNAAGVVQICSGAGFSALGSLICGISNAGTTDTPIGLTVNHASSGTPAAGYGITQEFQLQSSTTTNRAAADLTASWATATDASRKARLTLSVYDTATREVMRGEADGSNPMLGFYGTAATAKQTVSGSRGSNAALASLLTALATLGLITDSSS